MTDQTPAAPSAPAPAPAAAPSPVEQRAAFLSNPPTDTAASTPTSEPSPQGAPAPAAKPDWLPDSFWDKDKGAAKSEDFKKHLESLEKAKADFEAARGDTPAKADDYKAMLPQDFKLPDGYAALPPGTEFNEKDPLLGQLRKVANETGMSQKAFSAILGVEAMRMSLAQGGRVARDQALGENATARLGALDTWFKSSFGEQAAKQLNPSMFTPDIVKAWESVKQALTKQGVGSFMGSGREAPEANDGKPENWATMKPVDRITWTRQQQREQARARH